MKNFISISILLILILFGCQDSNQIEEVKPAGSEQLKAELIFAPLISYKANSDLNIAWHYRRGDLVERPVKFSSEGIIYFIPGTGDCTGHLHAVIEGSGKGSHMGNIIVELGYCTNGTKLLSPVLGTVTASNGDQIFVVLTGAGIDPDKGPFQDYMVYDGTGRFDGAMGSYTLYGLIDYVNGVWSHEGGGVISY